MIPEAITLLYEQELRLLEGWMHYRDMIGIPQNAAGILRLEATDNRIAECNARLEKLETMKGVKNELVS